mmetsp:Transcript_16221/g.51014  ORF Transcript_16221/g.51014 Transcript_16221/m.51014 type:complete len:235 (-) Transcript_16221:130-834(-)
MPGLRGRGRRRRGRRRFRRCGRRRGRRCRGRRVLVPRPPRHPRQAAQLPVSAAPLLLLQGPRELPLLQAEVAVELLGVCDAQRGQGGGGAVPAGAPAAPLLLRGRPLLALHASEGRGAGRGLQGLDGCLPAHGHDLVPLRHGQEEVGQPRDQQDERDSPAGLSHPILRLAHENLLLEGARADAHVVVGLPLVVGASAGAHVGPPRVPDAAHAEQQRVDGLLAARLTYAADATVA